jgi:site-specific recombinase XerD
MSSIGRERKKPRQRIPDPYQAFLAWVERERSVATLESYRRILGHFQTSFPKPEQVTAEQVRDWLAVLSSAPTGGSSLGPPAPDAPRRAA